jgi:hypothetical protein
MEEICDFETGPDAPGGCCGLLLDDVPMLLASHVRPYVIAILLHRGAVRSWEVIASLTPHCSHADLRIGEWDPIDDDYCDQTRLEKLIDEVLGNFVAEGVLRYNEEQDMWVLTGNKVSMIISWVTSLGAKLPHHLNYELSRQQLNRIPEYIEFDYVAS